MDENGQAALLPDAQMIKDSYRREMDGFVAIQGWPGSTSTSSIQTQTATEEKKKRTKSFESTSPGTSRWAIRRQAALLPAARMMDDRHRREMDVLGALQALPAVSSISSTKAQTAQKSIIDTAVGTKSTARWTRMVKQHCCQTLTALLPDAQMIKPSYRHVIVVLERSMDYHR